MAKVRGVTTSAMPKIPNYYTKHTRKWVTEYNSCSGGKLPLHVSTDSIRDRPTECTKKLPVANGKQVLRTQSSQGFATFCETAY
jgi:hypothetical protein